MKGIILAAGKGTRLYPTTKLASKELLIVYNKPMIYYPLNTLIKAGIKDILLINNSSNIGYFANLFKSGSDFGINITYKVQDEQRGIADAVKLAKNFVGKDNFVLILGDNYFENNFSEEINNFYGGAKIFIKEVENPERFGVAFINNNKITKIVEKPTASESKFAVTGFYIYDSEVFDIIDNLKPSDRGELEITDVNINYLQKNKLSFSIVNNHWVDMGTPDSIIKASLLIQKKERSE